ncbi:hypothetical protein TcasGA2_TC012865 [Tribolium castaneum]|uniref:Uncharacterized protein n=1 Tax=Tribolium castaneum TaxID=7070 RepID=D6X1B5_TRICA|nr:hypothetical protein TcasGA2_TC012865 [Tribolium castaneum]
MNPKKAPQQVLQPFTHYHRNLLSIGENKVALIKMYQRINIQLDPSSTTRNPSKGENNSSVTPEVALFSSKPAYFHETQTHNSPPKHPLILRRINNPNCQHASAKTYYYSTAWPIIDPQNISRIVQKTA